jgi:CelD/BcsL family acetyltransferase involved in cellulose biosynthesis
LQEYGHLWRRTRNNLPWDCLFVTPFWLQSVVGHLGANGDPHVLTVSLDGDIVGIAPLSINDQCAFFLGIPDVCDYQDVIIAPGHGEMVFHHLLDYLSQMGIGRLDLQTLRPHSALSEALEPLEKKSRISIHRLPSDVTYEATLPVDWEGYLMQLNGKQRHEVRRKLRRLEAHGTYAYRMADCNGDLTDVIAQFLRLFQLNRKDKAAFMDDTMSAYFRDLIQQLARQQMLRLYFLDVDEQPAATVLCFDYNGVRYLYNSGYDAQFNDLSVGILSKVLSIQKGIEAGCRRYDFLKGAEVYKKRIGGKKVPLHRYLISF